MVRRLACSGDEAMFIQEEKLDRDYLLTIMPDHLQHAIRKELCDLPTPHRADARADRNLCSNH